MPASASTTAALTTARTVRSSDAQTTRRLASGLAVAAQPGDVICLWGDLGAGKTQFAKGYATGLGIGGTVVSPSFILMAEYAGRLPLFHIDLYRLADASDALAGGLLDERQAAGVTLVEWPERLGTALPRERLDVRIAGTADEPRTVRIVASPRYARYLEAVG
jgi:tRNA threonylcarbamoyladenosine biosynthesis protein TsaE